ncbi:hypothetical protein [Zhihengliuella flava]|uniref:Uncharacterized protein n=1 Tax=Zhihengliuella flava TaxID=1285193 RepID=A0A931GHI1_9MICC|nr:hypothetical protein [Zhihengliuella flava]MBG6083271.1 hypothetical protein [Zhihengliuella flava]
MTRNEKGQDRHVRPFNEFLTGEQATHRDLSDGLHDLLAAVADTGKSGTVTLTVKVEPDKKAADGIYRITNKVAVKAPVHDAPSRIYYADKTGNLTRNNPDQEELDGLRVVDSPAEPSQLREAK